MSVFLLIFFKELCLWNFNENFSSSWQISSVLSTCLGTTIDIIAEQIIKIIESNDKLYGIHHITGPKISKYDLLQIINNKFNLNKNIIPIDKPNICRLLEDDLVDTPKLNWKSFDYI